MQHLLDHAGGWNQFTSPVHDPVFRTIQISTNMGLNYPAAPTNVISWMFSKPLDFTPGTTNVYSNFGYSLLGRIIEKACGKSYMDYIQQDLLGDAGLTNILGFTNVVQSHSRPRDLAPWEIWYADVPQFLTTSAVDFPTNLTACFVDGADYYESYDSFGGLSASGIGLCHYLLNYLEGNIVRPAGITFSWNYIFYGSLPGASAKTGREAPRVPEIRPTRAPTHLVWTAGSLRWSQTWRPPTHYLERMPLPTMGAPR